MRLNSKLKRTLEQRLQEGKPIAKYDLAQKRAYLEYSDGRVIYIDELLKENTLRPVNFMAGLHF